MARLNDPPIVPSVESIDALKRRFIRQNRELARVNSTQSLRIRNLEAEISRLLAENIAVREQAIKIAQQSEKWRAAHKATTEIASFQRKLQAKLQELNIIVTELGEVPEKAASRVSGPRTSILLPNNVRSPAEKEWRNRQTIGGVLNAERAEQEGRLPAILEDKTYSLRTMNHAELQTPIDDLGNPLESPELGPPPVAHFEVPEVEDYNQNTDPEKSPQPHRQTQPTVPLSVNLETRRKRRTSALLQDIPVEEDDNLTTKLPKAHAFPAMKAGAKRKLEANMLQDNHNAAVITTDDFVFRKAEQDIDSRGTRFTRPSRKVIQDAAMVGPSPAKDNPAVRKILAPKSTNSPAKSRTRVGDKSSVQRLDTEEELKIQKRPNRLEAEVKASSHDWKQDDIDAALQSQLQPKTPFMNELLSPASTEPSVRTQEMAITNSVEDVLNGSIGRASRRARAAVSYAEPSLRDKMRRPGKELVGAVEGIDKRAREGSMDRDRRMSEGPTSVDVQIKHERSEAATDWKKLPQAKEEAPSPLRDKQSKSPEDVKEGKKQSGKRRLSGKASLGISADYTADFTITDEIELENAVRRLSIFDPPSSSPPSGPVSGGPYPETIEVEVEVEPEPLKRSKSTTALDRKVRRHSVATSSSLTSVPTFSHRRSMSSTSNVRASSQQSMAVSRPSSAASQRPSSAASLRNGEPKTGHDLARKPSTSRFRTDSKLFPEAEKKAATTDSEMAETRANRRRSMMV